MKMIKYFAVPILLSLLTGNIFANVKLASPFGDHMVLQRNKTVPVWGTASPGEKVTITFNTQKKSIVTGADGTCRVNLSKLNLEGSAEWRGGIAQGPDNCILSKDLPVECGVNRVLVRSSVVAGNIIVKASEDGLKDGSGSFTSAPFIVKDRLSDQMPADGLKSRLDRGPTPNQPSYIVSRIPLTIVKATTGSNEDKVALSYDDNETTYWASEEATSKAWIQYELDKDSPVSEVTLKLNGFRTKSYPIRISVNDKVAFDGVSTRSLGYCTFTFPVITGRRVKIQLTEGVSTNENTRVEVNGKSLDDGINQNDGGAKGKLSIIEAEIYQKAE
ncbi:MAG: discoidin domain-containing protein [Bacteroidota bacterium]|nr:discoidin domain-containing protein [Bacteroidota bacterium]